MRQNGVVSDSKVNFELSAVPNIKDTSYTREMMIKENNFSHTIDHVAVENNGRRSIRKERRTSRELGSQKYEVIIVQRKNNEAQSTRY